ncbi:hypothetical protein EW146_g255 [Bondarzewia mesenterica]|uniref:Methyltransferase type 11 domain-containing protein n=1 Tax=Bondarzewia mesenterica TaxID=1095465 RepID=A0A4S4M7J4_9AGAM|nr:hypothetical protein EW146_g255 [Bondarzewia mesenterica]
MTEDTATAPPKQYTLRAACASSDEIERLNDMHRGIMAFLGQHISFAPLEKANPKSILELGHLPPNLEFQFVDLTKPLPFEKASFDVLPGSEDILRRVFDLVKPGGWLLIEDPDDGDAKDGEGCPSPAVHVLLTSWLNILRSRGAQPTIARDLESIIRSSGLFDEVNVRKVVIPLSGQSNERAENELGRTWKEFMKRNSRYLSTRYSEYGITEDLLRRSFEELDDSTRSLTTVLYFTWSHKRMSS